MNDITFNWMLKQLFECFKAIKREHQENLKNIEEVSNEKRI